jgi:hypothetical protein
MGACVPEERADAAVPSDSSVDGAVSLDASDASAPFMDARADARTPIFFEPNRGCGCKVSARGDLRSPLSLFVAALALTSARRRRDGRR